MSIILKALKSSEQPAAEEKKVVLPDNEEGFFHSGQSVVKKSSFFSGILGRLPKLPARTWILAGVFVFICGFSLTFWLSKRHAAVTIPPPVVQVTMPAVDQLAAQGAEQPSAQTTDLGRSAALLSPADAAFGAGNYDESLKLYKAELEKNKDDAKLHNNIGMVYLKKELYASANDEFKKALELDGNCAECFNNFGYLKSLLNQTEEAQRYFEKAMRIDANYPDPYFNLAVLFEKDGDIGSAVKYYQQFVTIYPDKNAQILLDVNKRMNFLKGK